MMKKLLVIFSFLVLAFTASPVLSQGFGKDIDAPVRLVNPIGGTEQKPEGTVDTRIIFGRAIRVTLGFLGTFTLAVFFYGGYLWLTSAGNSDKVQKGFQTMFYAVVGLFIIFGAYGILNTVISGLRGGASSNNWLVEENKTPYGPENDPNAQQACDGQPEESCRQLNYCAYVNFDIPADAFSVNPECVNADQKTKKCEEFYEQCVIATEDISPVALVQCDDALTQCKNQ